MAVQLNSLGEELKRIAEQRSQPGHPRPEEEIYLNKLAAEAEKAVSAGIRAEVNFYIPHQHTVTDPAACCLEATVNAVSNKATIP